MKYRLVNKVPLRERDLVRIPNRNQLELFHRGETLLDSMEQFPLRMVAILTWKEIKQMMFF